MSLMIWLPLIGNLNNYGTKSYNITSIETPTYVTGKIGRCYQRANTSSQLTNGLNIDNNLVTDLGNQASVAVWVKPLGTHTHYNGTIISSGNWNSKKWAFGLSQDNTKVDVLCGGYNNYITCSVPVNQWTHLVSVYDNGVCSLYKNGEYIGQLTGQAAFVSDASNTCICRETYASGYFGLNGCINDLRVYNHCLSAAEIHEISQGLVLHYKFEDSAGYTELINRGTTWNIYNNHNNTNMPSTLTATGEYFANDRVYRESCTPTANSLSSIQTTLGSHGVYNWSRTFNANTKYVFWIYYKPITHADTRCGGTASNIGGWTEIPPVPVGGGWYRVGQYRDGSVTSNKTDSIFVSFKVPSATVGTPIVIDWASPHLLQGTTEIPPDNFFSTTIIDSSGYGYNSTFTGTPGLTPLSRRYSLATHFGSYNNAYTTLNDTSLLPALTNCTITYWCRHDNTSNSLSFTGQSNSYYVMATNSSSNYYHANAGSITVYRDGVSGSYKSTTEGWHLLALTGVNLSSWTQFKINSYSASWPFNATISDLRIYVTQLSATDIKQLYEVNAKIDNKGNFHTYELAELQNNLLFKTECARIDKAWKDGLSSYTQANCQVTLTDNGYRIYRPPNLTTAANGNTMWGGLRLNNQSTGGIHAYNVSQDNMWLLQQGHTYLIGFHVKGQSSNSTTFGFTNNMGWGGGGVSPNPTVLVNDGIPTDFNGEKDCTCIFTINDTIAKTCTAAYSSYTAGTTYLSYRDFTFGWGYTSTGSLGTDVYITNLHMYDITSIIAKLSKNGVMHICDLNERMNDCRLIKNAELCASEFIEL